MFWGCVVPKLNRQFLLAAHPEGELVESDLSLHGAEMPNPSEGEVLVKLEYIAVEPAMRGWMANRADYAEPMAVGDLMRAFGVGAVIESRNPDYAVGDRLSGFFGMQEYAIADGRVFPLQRVDEKVDSATQLGVLGVTGLTAWCGLHAIGQPKAGETVVVSGAAGATGSIVGQLAKLAGCRVIGIAGSDGKTGWLQDELGFDGAVNYKTGDVAQCLQQLCPEGIDIYWDNVGGEQLDIALEQLARGARVVICGAISRYNARGPQPGPVNYFNLVFRNAMMKGFVVSDYVHLFPEASASLKAHLLAGHLRHTEDILEGFENLPRALLRLFRGENRGKQLVRV